jgi:hypothetical protein
MGFQRGHVFSLHGPVFFMGGDGEGTTGDNDFTYYSRDGELGCDWTRLCGVWYAVSSRSSNLFRRLVPIFLAMALEKRSWTGLEGEGHESNFGEVIEAESRESAWYS